MADTFPHRLILLAALVFCLLIPVSANPDGNTMTYSIVHLSDTQNLATHYPATCDETFRYLESEKAAYNLSAIIITGDLVNTWNSKKEWEAYAHARSLTTIPVYTIAGNHDTDYGSSYRYYSLYTGEPDTGYVTYVGDIDLVGINYAKKTLSSGEFSPLKATLANSSRSYAIIATHYYMNEGGALSPLGKDINRNLILKPTLVLTGHVHADFTKTRNVGDFPVVGEMTNYQYGVPGGNGDENYSAGMLYTITSSGGNVERVTARVIHIYPVPYEEEEKMVFERNVSASQPSAVLPAAALYEPPVPAHCDTGDLLCLLDSVLETGRAFFRSAIPGPG